jgi:hypothetical protein
VRVFHGTPSSNSERPINSMIRGLPDAEPREFMTTFVMLAQISGMPFKTKALD